MSSTTQGTLSAIDFEAKKEELENKEKVEPKKPVRRSNSFNRRKKKTEDSTAGGDTGQGDVEPTEAKKPEFKEVAQADPLRESLQQDAIALYQEGRYDEAGEKWYYLAEAARNAGDGSQEAMAMLNMGTSLVNMLQYEQAFACYDRALHLAEQAQDVSAQIDAYVSLKWIFQQPEVSALHNACRCLECVIDLIVKETGDTASLAGPLFELGQLLYMQEDFIKAKERFNEALEVAREHNPEEYAQQSSILLELANATLEIDGAAAAMATYQSAIDEADKSTDNALRLQTRHDASMILLHHLKRLEDAEAMLKEMMSLAVARAEEEEAGSSKALHAMEMEGRGCIELVPLLVKLGKSEEAHTTAARGIELATKLDIDEASGVCNTQMGEVLLAASKPAEALPYLNTARSIWRKVALEYHEDVVDRRKRSPTRFCRDNPEHLSLFDNSAKDTYVKLAAATLDAGEPDCAKESLLAIEEGRGATMNELMGFGAPPSSDEAETAADDTSPPHSLEFDANALTQLLADVFGPDAPASKGAIIYWSLGVQMDTAAAEGSGDGSPELQKEQKELWTWVITADGDVKVKRGTSIVVDGDMSKPISDVVWDVMEKLRLSCHTLPTRGHSIHSMGEQQVEAMRERHGDCDGDVDIDKELRQLSGALLDPIAEWLPEGAPLVLMPHYYLNLVPFGALPLPGGEPLITKHPLSQAGSLKVLAKLATFEKEATASASSDSLIVCPNEPLDDMPPFEHSDAEAEAVAAALQTAPELQLSGKRATLGGVLLALEQPLSAVHVCAHMPQRYIQLASVPKLPSEPPSPVQEVAEDGTASPAEEQPAPLEKEEDRELVMDHLYSMHLSSHPAVTLSGSHGGAGEFSQDGVISLPRAFLVAGARSVLANLWDAVDEPSTKLLASFYQQKREKGQAAALQAAVLELCEAEGGKWKHPKFWAGFTLTGTPAAI
mmetsp:Transcript_17158/g.28747  ORF Transcript_17158/g.28747 Transcript_17158/m.28747 type:complete len:951 (+) Transcript_17158:93-2945(+)